MYINCLRKEHKDNKASAILNDGSIYIKDSVKCMGCGKWYMRNTPNLCFSSYAELLNNLTGTIPCHINNDYLPYHRYTTLDSFFERHPKKSRERYSGQTLKSNLKSDRKVEINGSVIYPDKFPKAKDDLQGTHESVKEFFFNEKINDNGSIDMERGFYNRISVDSDEQGDILPRLKDIAEISGVRGFWFILNNGNNKFQAIINFYHTVLNGHDLTKVKEVSACINQLTGDEHMTNSFMKNHKVYTGDTELFMGAQTTRTYGFDAELQKDFENFIDLKEKESWNSKWSKMTDELVFINRYTGKEESMGSESICLFREPSIENFNIRRDNRWSLPIEILWLNTSVKYKRFKNKDGKTTYTRDIHSQISRRNMNLFHMVSSILKDQIKSTKVSKLLRSSMKVKIDKYIDYYTNKMKVYNKSQLDIEVPKQNNFKLLGLLLDDSSLLLEFVSILKVASQNGLVSLRREKGLEKSWEKVIKHKAFEQIPRDALSLTSNELDMIRKLFPLLQKISIYPDLKRLNKAKFNSLTKEMKAIVSIATESTYYKMQNVIQGVSKSDHETLSRLLYIDFGLYRYLSQMVVMIELISSNSDKNMSLGSFNSILELHKHRDLVFSSINSKEGYSNKKKDIDYFINSIDAYYDMYYNSLDKNSDKHNEDEVKNTRIVEDIYKYVKEDKIFVRARDSIP